MRSHPKLGLVHHSDLLRIPQNLLLFVQKTCRLMYLYKSCLLVITIIFTPLL